MDGLDVIRELREWEKKHRPALCQHVVGISAHASGTDADRGLLLGMDAFQSKPIKLEDLQNIADSEQVGFMSRLLDERSQMAGSEDPRPQEACLIAAKSSTLQAVTSTFQENGWMPVPASSRPEFVEKLRARNWEAVVVDADVPGFSTSVQEFREWESQNRVCRQRNLFVLSSSSLKPTSSAQSLVELAQGIDGVFSKPTTNRAVEKILEIARTRDSSSFTADDIVTR